MKRKNLEFLLEDNKSNKSLIIGSIIATFIALSPYLFYLYESVPQEQVWNTFLFTYDSKSWGDANLSMWILTGKTIPLLFLLIWFFTCRHWWYHALLVPIIMYIYQIIILLNDDLIYFDEFQLIYLVPVMAIIIPSIYLIRAKMFDKLNTANKTLEELEEEFTVRPKTLWGKVRQYF
ncbi:hypothetical protein [Lacinutrix sp. WUR7]|uniref:hypothetical protein n=1 Tax=Lacinutrix sp. WUR7 TaxID=2653681 RepID=UPI001EEFF165|nr:hypothetical protein [Lacinutrix sp. WUR7]